MVRTAAGAVLGAMLAITVVAGGGCGSDGRRTSAPTPTPTATATPLATATSTRTASATATPNPPPTSTATSSPTPSPSSLCAERRGGALVRFSVCKQTLTVWSTEGAFIDEAIALLASGEQRIPVFGTLLDAADCDLQWTWHPDPAVMSFADLAIELCDGCPSHIEDDKGYWLDTVGQYCPWTAQVIAVEDRR